MNRRLSSLLAVAGILVLPATAAAAPAKQAAPQPGPGEATVKVKVGHLEDGRAEIMQKVPVTGTLAPFVAGEKVKVTFYLDGKILFSRNLAVGKAGAKGTFRTSIEVRENGKYAVAAKHVATPQLGADETVRKSWKVSFRPCTKGSAATSSSASRRRCGRWATSPTLATASGTRPDAGSSPTAKSTA